MSEAQKDNKQKSSRKARAALALTSVAISLLIAEGGLRVLKRHIPFQPDPDYIRSLRPNVTMPVLTLETDDNLNGRSSEVPPRPTFVGYNNTNNLGLRMQTDVGPKAPGEKRVLLLGDSFTEAEGVPAAQRYADLVDARLAKEASPGTKWRVINGAIQNGSPSQYILQLRRFLPEIQPDLVIVALSPNDVVDDLNFERSSGFTFDAGGFPVAPVARTRLRLLQSSYLLRYVEVFLFRRSTSLYATLFPAVSPEVPVVAVRDMLCRAAPEARDHFQKKTGRYLGRIKEMVEASGARLGVFMIQYMWAFDAEPFHEPLYPGLRREFEDAGCYANHGKPYNDFIEGFLRDARIPFENPHATFMRAKAENPKRKLWAFVDYHYSPAGHAVAAEGLYALLERMK